jgi:hypothetical protein
VRRQLSDAVAVRGNCGRSCGAAEVPEDVAVNRALVAVEIDQRAEAVVGNRAVVALEKVLGQDFPVGLDVVRPALAQDEVVVFEAALLQQRQPRRCKRGQRFRLGIGTHERERPNRFEPKALQPEIRVGARFVVHTWRLPQCAVQVVRPGVIATLERLS